MKKAIHKNIIGIHLMLLSALFLAIGQLTWAVCCMFAQPVLISYC